MTRFIQEMSQPAKVAKAAKEVKPKPLKKPGEYTSYELSRAKKIISSQGGKR